MKSSSLGRFTKSSLKWISVLAVLTTLGACSSTQENKNAIVDSNTMLLIDKVNEIAPQAITGKFILTIKNTDVCGQNGNVCLNTQLDYRDQRAVTVVIPRGFVRAMTQMHGEHPEKFFENKRIEVRGAAKRQKIIFFHKNGEPSEKYYYQTHILPERPETIRVIPTV